MITRRKLLVGTASTLVLSAASGGALAQVDVSSTVEQIPFGIIDAHCHIFNASDLPVEGFLRQCYFHIYKGEEELGCRVEEHGWVGRWLREKGAAVAGAIMSGADSARTEAEQLRQANQARVLIPAGPTREEDPVADALMAAFGAPNAAEPSAAPDRHSDYLTPEERSEIQKGIEREGTDEFAKYFLKQAGEDASQSDVRSAAASNVTGRLKKLRKSQTEPSRTLDWAALMKGSRLQHASVLSGLYGGSKKKVILHTPALVDYSHWLNDHPESEFKDQAEVMEQLCIYFARTEEVLFHGYMAFDPLRDFLKPGTSFELVKDAVENKGFVGAKLYPPMGFKALDNSKDSGMTFPNHLLFDRGGNRIRYEADLASGLDARLTALYSWCADNGVPILAHAHDSYGSGPCYGKRADPKNWQAVRDRFEDIRVCLAHLGGFYDAIEQKENVPTINMNLLKNTWEWNLGNLVQDPRAKNFYVDVSDYTQVIQSKGTANLKEAFVEWVREFKNLPERLIYGSDWILLDREENKEKHLTAVYDFLASVFRAAYPGFDEQKIMSLLQDVFLRNAIRFLGIDPGGTVEESKSAHRLLAFYKQHGLMPNGPIGTTFLDKFRLR